MSNLVEFQESERSPIGSQATSGRGIPNLATSVDFHVGSIDAVNKQISDSFRVSRNSVVAPLVCEQRCRHSSRASSSRTRHVYKSQAKIQITEKKRKRKQSTSAPQSSSPEKNSLIETAVYPGYSPDHPTPLPQGMDAKYQLQQVIEAQEDLKCKPTLRKFWTTHFLSQCSQAIFLDMFWWFFLQKFQVDQVVQDCLFTRISDHYVELLRDCAAIAVDTKCAGTFLRRYPDSISQAVYSTFMHGYPASWKRFNEEFRTDLCNTVYMWQVGTKPISNHWLHWNYSMLEPDNELKHMATSEESTSPNKSPKSASFNLEKLLEEEKMNTSSFPEQAVGKHVNQAVNHSTSDHTLYSQSMNGNKTHCIAKQSSHILPQVFAMDTDSKISVVPMPVDSEQQLKGDTTQVKPPSKAQPKTKGWAPNLTAKPPVTHKQSHPMGQGAVFAHVVFDTYGHSPLVRHYLERRGLLQTAGYSILVKRTEVEKLPPIETPTYQDFLHESSKTSKLTHATFDRNYCEQMQAMNRFERQLQKERNQHSRNMSNILSKPRVVRKLSNALLLEIMGEGRRIAQISNCIDETLEQLKQN